MNFSLHPDLVRDGIVLGDFPLSRLLLINDAAYPWCVLVPRVPDIKDAHELTDPDQQQLTRESRALSIAMMRAFDGEKMNVAALGNMTPQLHVHHIVRYAADPAWPGPIWGVQPLTEMTPDEDQSRQAHIIGALDDLPIDFRAFDGPR